MCAPSFLLNAHLPSPCYCCLGLKTCRKTARAHTVVLTWQRSHDRACPANYGRYGQSTEPDPTGARPATHHRKDDGCTSSTDPRADQRSDQGGQDDGGAAEGGELRREVRDLAITSDFKGNIIEDLESALDAALEAKNEAHRPQSDFDAEVSARTLRDTELQGHSIEEMSDFPVSQIQEQISETVKVIPKEPIQERIEEIVDVLQMIDELSGVVKLIPQDRVQHRTLEQTKDLEEIVEAIQFIPLERISERIVEQIVDTSVPQIRKHRVEVVKVTLRERLQQRTVEQSGEMPVPQTVEEIVVGAQTIPQECISERIMSVDVPRDHAGESPGSSSCTENRGSCSIHSARAYFGASRRTDCRCDSATASRRPRRSGETPSSKDAAVLPMLNRLATLMSHRLRYLWFGRQRNTETMTK